MTKELEEDKENARWLIENGETAARRAEGVLREIQVFYTYFTHDPVPKHFPTFETYASHWLWANGDAYEPEMRRILIKRFGVPRHPRISKGFTSWEPRCVIPR